MTTVWKNCKKKIILNNVKMTSVHSKEGIKLAIIIIGDLQEEIL